MARTDFNFKTPDELNWYLDKMVSANNKWWTKLQAYEYLSSLWATVDWDKLDDIDWNEDWVKKLWWWEWENKKEEVRKPKSWETWYSPVDTENYSNTWWNEQLITDTYLSWNLTRDEKEKAINELKNKNSQASIEAIKKWDTEWAKRAWQERTMLKWKTKTIDEKWKEKSWVNLKNMSDYITYNMTDDEMNKQINDMTQILSSNKSDSSKWSNLSKYYNNATTISRQINWKINWIKAAQNLTPEQKTAIINTLTEQRDRYVAVAEDAKNKIDSLWELSWYEKLW